MYLCRAALQRFSSLTRPCITHRAVLQRDVVPRRLMSSVPGGKGENLVYVLLCGGAFAGAVAYAYRTVTRDSARYSDRISEIASRPKVEWKPKSWPSKSAEEAEEAAEDTPEAVVETVSEVVVEDAEPVVLAAEVKTEAGSVVEKVAEVVVETAETVAEVASVVETTAQEVAAVAHEVEKIAEEVEAAAKMLETTALPAVEEADAESNEAKDNAELTAASLSDNSLDSITKDIASLESVPEKSVVAAAEESPVAQVENVPASQADEEANVTPIVEEVLAGTAVEESVVAQVDKEVPVAPEVEDPVVTVSETIPLATAEDEAPSDAVATEAAADSPVTDVINTNEAPVVTEGKTESLEVVAESPIEEVAASKPAEEYQAVAETTTPVKTAEEEPASEAKHEYVVVVLEGAHKAVKPKVTPVPDDMKPSGEITGQEVTA